MGVEEGEIVDGLWDDVFMGSDVSMGYGDWGSETGEDLWGAWDNNAVDFGYEGEDWGVDMDREWEWQLAMGYFGYGSPAA